MTNQICVYHPIVQVQWVVTEDRGPNGAKGKGKFKPAFSVGLVVTLYKVCTYIYHLTDLCDCTCTYSSAGLYTQKTKCDNNK